MAGYSDLSNIRNSTDFNNRSTMAVANYARYILGESVSTSDHARRFDWAKSAALNASGTASQLSSYVVLDPTFTALDSGTADSTSLTDAQFDSIVQTAVNNTLLAW